MKKDKTMTNLQKALFVKLWREEYETFEVMQELREKIEFYQQVNRGTRALERHLVRHENRAGRLYDRIVKLTAQGVFSANAVSQCRTELGNLEGYVGDCFHDAVIDAQNWLDAQTIG